MKGAAVSDLNYGKCTLCARNCGVNRYTAPGACKMNNQPTVSRAALHFWEEPIISGTRGSGTIFFAGCSLSCVYCQNYRISRGGAGKPVSHSELADLMLRLQSEGAHNVNFVTPTHFAPSVAEAISIAKAKGLNIPVVYNTGGYDNIATLRALEGLVDIYLPDLKYYLPKTAAAYSNAPDYPTVAREAIAEMVRQSGKPVIENGIMKRGTLVRILLLPAHIAEAKLSLKYLYSTYGDDIYVSLMNQYTPMPTMKPPLDRRVTAEEYRQLTDYADRLGITNCFVQEFGTASESFIPDFDLTGV